MNSVNTFAYVLAFLQLIFAWATPLEPSDLWGHFQEILKIPRCSGKEAGMKTYIRHVAGRHGFTVLEDGARNLIVKRPAVVGSYAEPVILQTHLDMVCEKNSQSTHDFDKDPIVTTIRDGWLVADDTTLGSDNGIGVSLSLALMESPANAVLPPLEFVFTVEEETGLFGASDLDVSLLSGRKLLNFDSEEFGIIYIGCAGGGDATVELKVQSEPLELSHQLFQLELKGLRGGHSGADIHEGRGNALLLLARAVVELQAALPEVRLSRLEGGNKDNAIPRESLATLAMYAVDTGNVEKMVATIEKDLMKEFGRVDPGLRLEMKTKSSEGTTPLSLSRESAQRLLDLVLTLPYGPLKMSHEVEGLVETSNNVAKVEQVAEDLVKIGCFPRSSIDSALEDAQRRIARTARLCGATVARTFTFPGWAPNASQALLALAQDEFAQSIGSTPQVAAIHAGLECGLIGGRIPGIEMVSFGPDIKGAHAPGERVNIESVRKTSDLARNILQRLAATEHNARSDL